MPTSVAYLQNILSLLSPKARAGIDTRSCCLRDWCLDRLVGRARTIAHNEENMTLRKTLSNALLLAPNRVFRRALDWPGRPVFYDVDQVCPELRCLERNYLSIKAEFD